MSDCISGKKNKHLSVFFRLKENELPWKEVSCLPLEVSVDTGDHLVGVVWEGSKQRILLNYIQQYNSTVIERCRY